MLSRHKPSNMQNGKGGRGGRQGLYKTIENSEYILVCGIKMRPCQAYLHSWSIAWKNGINCSTYFPSNSPPSRHERFSHLTSSNRFPRVFAPPATQLAPTWPFLSNEAPAPLRTRSRASQPAPLRVSTTGCHTTPTCRARASLATLGRRKHYKNFNWVLLDIYWHIWSVKELLGSLYIFW